MDIPSPLSSPKAPTDQPPTGYSPEGPPAVVHVTSEQLSAAAKVTAHARLTANESSNPFIAEYDQLRIHLQHLWSAPVRDMHAIHRTMSQLDEAHAAFKAQHKTDDPQRY